MGGRSDPSRPLSFLAAPRVYSAPSMNFHRPLFSPYDRAAGAVALTFAPASLTGARERRRTRGRPERLQGARVHVQQDRRRRASRRRDRQPGGDVECRHHRRQRRARRRPHVSPAAPGRCGKNWRRSPRSRFAVVNSHYHFDHSHGNQIYGPEVEIIGHDYTRADGCRIARLTGARVFCRRRAEHHQDPRGTSAAAKTPEERSQIETQLAIQRNHLEGTNADGPTPPTMTLTRTMTAPRRARDPTAVPRPRPHCGRCRGLSAEGTHRRHRRSADRRAVAHGRRTLPSGSTPSRR